MKVRLQYSYRYSYLKLTLTQQHQEFQGAQSELLLNQLALSVTETAY
jgi:hypothetical protein